MRLKPAHVSLATALALLTGTSAASPSSASEPHTVRSSYTRRVAIVLYEGVEVLDFAGPSEVLEAASRLASDHGKPAFELYTVAPGAQAVESQGFISILPRHSLETAPLPDIIVVPGGDTRRLLDDPHFIGWFERAAKGAEVTLTVCTGAFVPARLGMLKGLEATTWYGALPRLRAAAPGAVVEGGRRFVDSGSIVTTAGVSAGIDGSLHLVARLLGKAVASRTARYMEYRWAPEASLDEGYSYLNPSLSPEGRALQQAELALEEKDYKAATDGLRVLLRSSDKDAYIWLSLSAALKADGQPEAALAAAQKAANDATYRADALYSVACLEALRGNTGEALSTLRLAVEAGFANDLALERDPDLSSLRESEAFKELLRKLRS